jgi:hypothetical protein
MQIEIMPQLCPDQSTDDEQGFYSYQKLDVFHKPKVPGVHPEILHHFGMVHVVGIMVRNRVVTEGCHLLGRVAGQRFVYPRTSTFRCFLQEIKQSMDSKIQKHNKKCGRDEHTCGAMFIFH